MKHYKENWLGEEIVIDNKLDPVCKVYHGETLIGKCKSLTTLQNIQTQIKAKYISEVVKQNKDWTPYYIEFEGKKLEITSKFGLFGPDGFYDQHGKALKKYYDISSDYLAASMEQIKTGLEQMMRTNSNNIKIKYNPE